MATSPMPIIAQNYQVPNVLGSTIPYDNLTTAQVTVLAAQQSRQSVIFHNPGSVNILVAQLLDTAGSTIVATFASPGGGFVIYPGGMLTIKGNAAQGAWRACAESGSTGALTILIDNTVVR